MVSDRRPVHDIAVALIRRGDEVLLVRQQGPDNPASFWVLPGSIAEEDELLTEALAREVREETGLSVREVGPLAYAVQTDNRAPGPGYLATAFVFEITGWDGELRPADPDGYVKEARFHPVSEAIREVEKITDRMGGEPAMAHLRGEIGPGAMWFYRRSRDGNDSLVETVP